MNNLVFELTSKLALPGPHRNAAAAVLDSVSVVLFGYDLTEYNEHNFSHALADVHATCRMYEGWGTINKYAVYIGCDGSTMLRFVIGDYAVAAEFYGSNLIAIDCKDDDGDIKSTPNDSEFQKGRAAGIQDAVNELRKIHQSLVDHDAIADTYLARGVVQRCIKALTDLET